MLRSQIEGCQENSIAYRHHHLNGTISLPTLDENSNFPNKMRVRGESKWWNPIKCDTMIQFQEALKGGRGV